MLTSDTKGGGVSILVKIQPSKQSYVICINKLQSLRLFVGSSDVFKLIPITYGILRFRQVRGGGEGLFGLNPENKVTFNRLI